MKGKLGSPSSLSPHALAQSNAAFSDAWRAGKGDVMWLDRQAPLKIETPRIVQSNLSVSDRAHRLLPPCLRMARES